MLGQYEEMREFFDQVLRAADAGLYYLALFGALSIPDICASMEAEDGQTNGSRYAAWFDAHVAAKYTVGPDRQPSVTGDDAYGLRCSMLHQARTRPHKGSYSRVLFVEPGHGVIAHNNVMVVGDADQWAAVLNLDVGAFCRDLVDAANAWLTVAEQTAVFQNNYPHFLQRYPHGFPPFIGGVPVLS